VPVSSALEAASVVDAHRITSSGINLSLELDKDLPMRMGSGVVERVYQVRVSEISNTMNSDETVTEERALTPTVSEPCFH
jgi:hypothetical protein